MTTPTPELHGEYAVDVDGRLYTASFRSGALDRLSVTYQTQPNYRRGSGGRQTRFIWGRAFRDQGPATGRAAEIEAMVRDPAVAAKAGAKVESPEARTARYKRIDERLQADTRRQAAAAKLSLAAPAMLEALQAVLADAQVQHLDSGVVDMALAAVEAATKA